jgi:hypothetical protein
VLAAAVRLMHPAVGHDSLADIFPVIEEVFDMRVGPEYFQRVRRKLERIARDSDVLSEFPSGTRWTSHRHARAPGASAITQLCAVCTQTPYLETAWEASVKWHWAIPRLRTDPYKRRSIGT